MTTPKRTRKIRSLPEEVLVAIGQYVTARNRKAINEKRMTAADDVVRPWFATHVAGLPRDLQTIVSTVLVGGENVQVQSTWVQPTSEVLDTDALKAAIGVREFNKITRVVREVDPNKLAVAIKDGKISPEVIARVTSVENKKGFVKHTVV